jgi:lysostaphin
MRLFFLALLMAARPAMSTKDASHAAASKTAAAATAPALDVHFTPAAPRLGDTISVVVSMAEGDPAPTVAIDERKFPAFDLGGGRYRAFIPLSPLDHPGRWRVSVAAGKKKASITVPVGARRFGVQHIEIHGKTLELDPIERARVREAKEMRTVTKRWDGAFRAPSGGRQSSEYGVRRYRNGVFLTDYYHRGIDYAPGAGAPVIAPAGGTVVLVGVEGEGFPVHGNVVGLDHGHGVVSLFLHLQKANVREGDTVRAGETIGLVGSTGAATGPHLHWGLYVNSVCVDPAPWLGAGIE